MPDLPVVASGMTPEVQGWIAAWALLVIFVAMLVLLVDQRRRP